MFKINIHNLKEGEQEYEFSAKKDDLDLGDVDFSIPDEIKIRVVLFKIDNQISLKIFLNGILEFDCDRCLERYTDDINTEFDIVYKFEFRDMQKERDDIDYIDEDIKFIPPNTVFIDLKEDLRDFVLLSVPLKKVPEEKDGKCTFCRKNINEILNIPVKDEVNPVWEKLIKSKTK